MRPWVELGTQSHRWPRRGDYYQTVVVRASGWRFWLLTCKLPVLQSSDEQLKECLPICPEIVSDCDVDPVAPIGEDGRSCGVLSQQPLNYPLNEMPYLGICLSRASVIFK